MKAIFQNFLNLFFFSFVLLFSACSTNSGGDGDDSSSGMGEIRIEMSVNLNNSGIINQRVTYTSENGEQRTEMLDSNQWRKTIFVSRGFQLFFRAFGENDGGSIVEVNVEAEEGGVSIFSSERTETGGINFDFDITIEQQL